MSVEQDVLAANEAFYRAFQQRDLEAMSAVWSHGIGSLCVHPGRQALRGWEEIRSSWAAIFRNTSQLRIDIEVIQTEMSGDLAYVVLTEGVLQEAGGRRSKALSLSTNIFENMAQRWYLVHHHGSPIMR